MQNPYLLLTPGPLSTTESVKQTMLRDWCTWDDDYNHDVVQVIRAKLEKMSGNSTDYTSVLLQGSGTFAVEAAIGSFVPDDGKLLVIANGAYGTRIGQIADYLKIPSLVLAFDETEVVDPVQVKNALDEDPEITHLAMVHCETTTGILNPIETVCRIANEKGITTIVDAMSSFGGIPLDLPNAGIDVLISSANKCIQGVPGFGFVLARRELMEGQGYARSLSLDLHDQWRTMNPGGKWRFTSPTHTVRAFLQALLELEEEGGVENRYARYCENQALLVKRMKAIGFKPLIADADQSPFITTFLYPGDTFDFSAFYQYLKGKGFVLYPGKVSKAACFRIGTIGDVTPEAIGLLCDEIESVATLGKFGIKVRQKTSRVESVIAEISALFAQFGDTDYGEAITQLEHGLQSAELAEERGDSPAMIIAALLHDVGHFLHQAGERIADDGIDMHHEALGKAWLSEFFSDDVYQPVALHVVAKRYLCAKDSAYREGLSAASAQSLELQGGPLTHDACRSFESNRWFNDALQLREYDDLAKVIGKKTRPLDYFLDTYIPDLLERAAA